ncbi:MAG: DUF4249 domain-containing protein [Bacteroidetes bacterium]|nr:DUF4249 domain-containing protein [Bacteroidota bacterium]MBU1115707.1 DUF4249 domain-containing protein [Bacteroidota bacterium]MBU1799936.1 DUF4249 domain-containing protein [Bacteroidota bacterium]
MNTNKNINRESHCKPNQSSKKILRRMSAATSNKMLLSPVKKGILTITLVLMTFLLFSCEDVIQIDLNSANTAIVLEAKISDTSSVSTMVITKSTDFYTVGEYERVSDAVVIISDDKGKSATMIEVMPGEYRTDLIIGNTNTNYSVEVNVEGKNYFAESKMPNRIEIDSLTIEKSKLGPRSSSGKGRYILHIYFKDEPDIANYCRFKISHNEKDLAGFIVYDDKYTDGNDINARAQLDAEVLNLNIGDIITVELQSIDKATYDFYKTANSVNASGSSSGGRPSSTSVAPTNPISNWTNNALGYFSAFASSHKAIKISD